MFSTDEIKSKVIDVLKTSTDVPDGHRGAVVTIVNKDKVEVVVATKIKDNWTINFISSHSWTGENEIGAVSKVTW